MGNATNTFGEVVVNENENRRAFVRYQSYHHHQKGLFGSYVEFYFKISYLRWHFNIGFRYNDLLKLEKQLLRFFPNEMAAVERLSKANKFFKQHDHRFLEHRSKIMTRFLQHVIDTIPDSMEQPAIYRFLQYSMASFRPEFGRKGKEGYLKKSSGGFIEGFSNKFGDYVRVWKWRWVVLHDNCITWYKSPDSEEMLGCIQIDHEFGVAQAGRVISLKTGTRRLTFFAQNVKIATEWVAEFQKFYTPRIARLFYDAAYPPRMKNEVRVYTSGCEYYQAVALSLLQAQTEILIASWKNSPTVLLTRPPLPPLRLDQILKYKADQGVQIFVLLYKEVEHIGQGNDSFNTKKKLESLSPNIHCIRHPNKFMGGSTAVLWSHHEKLVVIDRNVAFVGGIDLAFQRWDDEKHLVADEDGVLFPGNDYRQPAPGVFKPVRDIDFENDPNDSDEEMIEVLVARPGESLPQATTSLVDDDDQPFEVEVVVDFGMSQMPASASNPVVEAAPTRDLTRSRSHRDHNIMSPPTVANPATPGTGTSSAPPAMIDDDQASVASNAPEDNSQTNGEDVTQEEMDAIKAEARGDDTQKRSSMYDSFQKGIATTKSSINMFSETVKSYASQAKAAAEQYITSQKIKKSSYWETRDLYPRMGWHDVHCGISGRAARDVASHFVQRWNHHRLSTSSHSYPIMRDITDDLNFTICAKCDLEGIFETESVCPNCRYDLGSVNIYSSPPSSVFLPSPIDRYSFLLFECRYSKEMKLPFRLHGDCPAIVTSIISSLHSTHLLQEDSEGVILDVGGPMSEWLQAFGLYPAVGDVIAMINGHSVSHLNSNQIKRLIKRIKKGVTMTVPCTGEYFTVAFRRHYLENLHPVDKMEETMPPPVVTVDPNVTVEAVSSSISPDYINHHHSNGAVPVTTADSTLPPEKSMLLEPATAVIAEAPPVNAVLQDHLGSSSSANASSNHLPGHTASSSASDYHPICQAAAHMEISFNMSRLFHEYAKFCDLPPRLCNDQGTCKVQVLRSIGKWSIGTKTECSILNCYIESIIGAHRFIYIENQFFISSLAGDGTQNKIAEALVDRILKAHTAREPFRVIVIIPLHPNGDFASAMKSKLVMHYEYMTINRGQSSLMNMLRSRAPGINVSDYITFYSLRNWGIINNKIVSDQVYVHDKVMIVDDRILIIGSANINDRSMLGLRDSEVALRIEDTFHIESVLCNQAHTVGYLPFTIRVKLMRQHLGNPSMDLTDPMNPQVFEYWKSTAANNSTYYDQLDGPMSYYRCTGSINYKNALEQFPNKSYLDPEAKQCVEQIKGFLVDWPQNFFSSEDLSPSLTTRALIPNEMWL